MTKIKGLKNGFAVGGTTVLGYKIVPLNDHGVRMVKGKELSAKVPEGHPKKLMKNTRFGKGKKTANRVEVTE